MCLSKIFNICKICNKKKEDNISNNSYKLNNKKLDKLDKIITDKLNSMRH